MAGLSFSLLMVKYLMEMGNRISRIWKILYHGFGKKCVARIWKINTRSNTTKASHGFGKEVKVLG